MQKNAHPLAKKIPSYIIGIFTEPAMLGNEDPALYWDMVSAMIDEEKPKTMFDWNDLQEYTSKLWEERFFRGATAAIIRGGRQQAVMEFLKEIVPGDKKVKHIGEVCKQAAEFFGSEKTQREQVHARLTKYGVTDVVLMAKSAQMNSDVILKFEKIVDSRQRSCRKLQKEMQKRRDQRLREELGSFRSPEKVRLTASVKVNEPSQSQLCPPTKPGTEQFSQDEPLYLTIPMLDDVEPEPDAKSHQNQIARKVGGHDHTRSANGVNHNRHGH